MKIMDTERVILQPFLHTTDRRPFFYDIFYSIAVARIFSTTYAEREREKNAWSLFYLLPPHHLHPPPRPVSVQFSQRTVPVSFCGSPDPRPPPSHTRTFRGLIQRIHSKDDDVNWITMMTRDEILCTTATEGKDKTPAAQ